MHEFRMTMCRAFVLYLIIALVAQKAGVLVGVRAIPSSLCAFGYGDNCERDSESCPASFYPPARAGDCAQCQMEGCAYCSYASKSECNFCQPGFYAVIETYPCEGPEGKCQRIKTCKRCKDPNCGYCTGDGSQCEDKGLVCKSHKAKAATKAKKVEWKGNACMNRMAGHGNGHTRYYQSWVKNGKCMDCKVGILGISPNLGKEMLCRVYDRALDVAANAWKGFDCIREPTYRLQNWCFGEMWNNPFGTKSLNVVFLSKCKTKSKGVVEKLISSNGGLKVIEGKTEDVEDATVNLVHSQRWTWAEVPSPNASGQCEFSKEYNLSPVACPRFQLVGYRNCKFDSATLTNGEYFINSFVHFVPKWKISGDSSSATVYSVRNCSDTVLKTTLRSGSRKLDIVSSSSKRKDTSFMIKPVGRLCSTVQLMRKSTSGGGGNEFLTVGDDCVKLYWKSKPSDRSQFSLERRCTDPDQYTSAFECVFNPYSLNTQCFFICK